MAYNLASAEPVAMTCCVLLLLRMLFLRQVMRDSDVDRRVSMLMSLAQSESLKRWMSSGMCLSCSRPILAEILGDVL